MQRIDVSVSYIRRTVEENMSMDYYMHWTLYFMQCIPSLFNSEYTLQVHAYIFRMAFRIRIYQEVIHKRIRQHVIIISEIGNDIYAGYITIPLPASLGLDKLVCMRNKNIQ